MGSGLYALTIAELATREFNLSCTIIEKRNHIGGNAFSYIDEETNVEVHKYGSHLFHTSSEKIFSYVQRFTQLNNYVHRVKAINGKTVYTLPFNLHTLNQVYGELFNPVSGSKKIREFADYNQENKSVDSDQSFESKAISSVGPEIYRLLVEGYTAKQWQVDPSRLPSKIISRIPVRLNFDDRYFSDTFQGLPLEGYTTWFEKMIDNSRISIFLGIDYFEIRKMAGNIPTIYTGALDRYFCYDLGQLTWRTLDFETEIVPVDDFQGTSVMNYTSKDVPYTRIHEFKHLHPERRHHQGVTFISREYSRSANTEDEPYYPVNSTHDRKLLARYRERAQNERFIHFGGRLGTYQYLDMHMAIGSAMQFMSSSFPSWFYQAKSIDPSDKI